MSKFPISSFGKQPTSRCRSAGGISLQPKIGYHGGMSRPGTPLTPSDLVNAKATPSPGEYGDPRGMVELIKLHKSGKFGLEDLPSVFDVHVALTAGFPGPSHYEETILPMDKGARFSTAYVPSTLDLLIREKGPLPAPNEYRPEDCRNISRYPRADLAVVNFPKSLRPSFITEMQRSKAFIPGPSKYQSKRALACSKTTKQHKRGGKSLFQKPKKRKSSNFFLDQVENIFDTLKFKQMDRQKEDDPKKQMNPNENNTKTSKRPQTSPEKFKSQQKILWNQHTQQFPGTRSKQRPSTTMSGNRGKRQTTSRIRKRTPNKRRRPSSSASTIMEKVSTRSRKALSKKLTSPLWKYEIDPKCIKKESNNSKGKGKTRNKNNKVNTHRHNADTKLDDLFRPTKDRPFLSIRETMELAAINVRAIDNASDSRRRKEVMGML